jgi:hypothetical protein
LGKVAIKNMPNTNDNEYKTTEYLASFLLLCGRYSENKTDAAITSAIRNLIEYINPSLKTQSIDKITKLPIIEKGSMLAGNIMLFKIPAYGVKIKPPDWLVYMFDICCGGNPGFIQLVYKELLVYINNSKYGGMGIPENYVITTKDFAECFPTKYQILIDPVIYKKYSKLWDEQKIKSANILQSDNMCDTPEYWLEVMYEGNKK